jgi:hypothetical protein
MTEPATPPESCQDRIRIANTIEDVLDELDFDTIQSVMDFLDWTWLTPNADGGWNVAVPSVAHLRNKVRGDLKGLTDEDAFSSSGFDYSRHGDHFTVKFCIEDVSSYELMSDDNE